MLRRSAHAILHLPLNPFTYPGFAAAQTQTTPDAVVRNGAVCQPPGCTTNPILIQPDQTQQSFPAVFKNAHGNVCELHLQHKSALVGLASVLLLYVTPFSTTAADRIKRISRSNLQVPSNGVFLQFLGLAWRLYIPNTWASFVCCFAELKYEYYLLLGFGQFEGCWAYLWFLSQLFTPRTNTNTWGVFATKTEKYLPEVQEWAHLFHVPRTIHDY